MVILFFFLLPASLAFRKSWIMPDPCSYLSNTQLQQGFICQNLAGTYFVRTFETFPSTRWMAICQMAVVQMAVCQDVFATVHSFKAEWIKSDFLWNVVKPEFYNLFRSNRQNVLGLLVTFCNQFLSVFSKDNGIRRTFGKDVFDRFVRGCTQVSKICADSLTIKGKNVFGLCFRHLHKSKKSINH